MIKKAKNWSTEEEWVLYLLKRDPSTTWSGVSSILEGRQDNSIKNYWNSGMKKKIPQYKKSFTKIVKEYLKK